MVQGGVKVKKWVPDYRPAMITDDIAFVGGSPVSVHCLVGDEGLILIDSGYPNMFDGICENLKRVGLDIGDVKFILHSHAHIDHYGCTMQIVRSSGAKTLLGREDEPIALGKVDLSWAKELHIPHAESFRPDCTFQDGDVLKLCGRTIRCVHAPGHTEGTYAFFIDTFVNGCAMTAAMHGGVGLNSMTQRFLTEYGLPLSCRDRFREGLHRLSEEHVDIVLGNHPQQNSTKEKLVRLESASAAFVDQTEWAKFLDDCEHSLDIMLMQENEEATAR